MNLERLNHLSQEEAAQELSQCCGSSAWVSKMLKLRPFASEEELFHSADRIWLQLSERDWLEAFSHHPQIGENPEKLRLRFASTASWAQQEQAGAAQASQNILHSLAHSNRAYREKFGYIFIVCATGKTADQMLKLLQERLKNQPPAEIKIAAAEQAKITKLRLEKLP